MTPKPNTVCDNCGTPIHRYPSRLKRNDGKYCSVSCNARAHGPPPAPRKRPVRERFRGKYRVDSASGCWLWTGATDAAGYGTIWVNELSRAARAPRVAYELFKGPIPDGMIVCHSCDVPACVNPEHLWSGTYADNTADMDTKGRRVTAVGDDHPQATVNDEAVKVFRWAVLRRGMTHERVARAYRVSSGVVRRAVLGGRWSHVDYWPQDRYAASGQKLNPQAVIVIRHMARAGRRLQDLADAFGIHYQTAYQVAAGERWGHVDYPTTREGRDA